MRSSQAPPASRFFARILTWFPIAVLSGLYAAAAEAPKAVTPAEVKEGRRADRFLAMPAKGKADPAARAATLRAATGATVSKRYEAIGGLEVNIIPAGADLDEVMADFQASGLYQYVEPDSVITLDATPNDPKYTDGTLWGLHNTGQSSGTNDADIDAPEAWDVRSDASSVVVAVIDSGIRYTHEDLAANMWTNPGEIAGNGTDDDGNGYIDDVHGINSINGSGNPNDDNGHGTHCAGTIGGVGNNAKGVAGVAWNVKLMGLKFLSASGSGSSSDGIECINYARLKGAHIMSNSWGGGGYSQALYDAIEAARQAGVIFVAAAGNDAEDVAGSAHYPSSYELDNMVSVAATNRNDALASFSNYGIGLVDVGAPGEAIFSTVNTSDAAYGSKSGTSMATPHVAGALAVLKAHFPGDSYRGLMNRLYRSTDPIPALAGKVQSNGRINLQAALATTTQAPRNDAFATPAVLPGGSLFLRSSNRHATLEASEPVHAGVATSANSVWWSWTAPATAPVTVNLAGSDFDTLLAVYTGTAVGSLTEVAGNDNAAPGSTVSRVDFAATAGVTYRIAVASKTAGVTGKVLLRIGTPPGNDSLAAAIALSGSSVTATGTNVNASKESGEPNHAGFPGGASVWWSWTAPASNTVAVSTAGSGFDTLLAVYTGDSGFPLSLVAQNDNSGTGLVNSRVTFTTVAGTTYRIAVDGKSGASGNVGLLIDVPPANDDFASRIVLSGMPASAAGTNRGAGKESGEPNHDGDVGGASVWWEWTAPATGTIEMNTVGSSFDTILAVYTGEAADSLTAVASDDESGGSNTSLVRFSAIAGTSYKIAVEGWNNGSSPASGTVALAIVTPPPPPANDAFADRVTITGLSASLTGGNATATKESGEPGHGGNAGGRSVWWTWTAPATGNLVVNTDGSTFDTTLGLYTGGAVNALTTVAGDDDSGSGLASRVELLATAGTVFQIAVDGYSSASGSIALSLEFVVPNFPPVISAATVTPSGSAYPDTPLVVATVDATDPEGDLFTLAYQWQSSAPNGGYVDEAGQDTATLAPSAGRSGKRWRCRITAADGVSSGLPFFTTAVDIISRPVQLARHGQAYSYDADLFVPGAGQVFARPALINEFSQGDTSGQNREWVEILVLEDTDLRGWTIRDSQGTAILTLAGGETSIWRDIQAGTLAVIYNPVAARDTILPADDVDPNDGNDRLIVNATVAPHCSGNWPLLGNGGDDIAVRDAGGTLIDAVSYGGRTTYLPAIGTVGSRTSARYNGGVADNVDSPANWTIHTAATASPGTANGTANATFVTDLRSGLYEQAPLYRFAGDSQLVPGLVIDFETGLVSGSPSVEGGGLFDVAIERYTPSQTARQEMQILVGSSAGVFTVPAARTWTLTGNTFIQGSLRVLGQIVTGPYQLEVRQSFASWKAAWEVAGGADDDPDGDGVTLYAEFAFDLNPHGHDPEAVPEFWLEESGKLRIRFRRQKGASDVTYAVEASDDLGEWDDLDLETQTVGEPESIGWDTEEVTVEDSGTTDTGRFLRVRATGE